MLRLNLYEMEGKNGREKNCNRVKMIEVLKKEYLKKQLLKTKKKQARPGKLSCRGGHDGIHFTFNNIRQGIPCLFRVLLFRYIIEADPVCGTD